MADPIKNKVHLYSTFVGNSKCVRHLLKSTVHLLKTANLHLLKTTDVINITFVQNDKGVRPLYKTTKVLYKCTNHLCTKRQTPFVHLYSKQENKYNKKRNITRKSNNKYYFLTKVFPPTPIAALGGGVD